jgi:molybdopterin-guanine dinucleotide biosynthesis protein A
MHESDIRPGMMVGVNVLGVVLAGGAGRRVGGGKAGLIVGGRPLIEYPIDSLRAAGLDVVVVAKADSVLPVLDAPVVHDAHAIRHPLAGIVTALDHAGGRPVLVVGADMPGLPPQLLARLAAADPAAAVVVARVGDALQPLCARYGPGVREALAEALAAEAPLRRTVEGLSPLFVATDAAAVDNVNTPEDLRRIRGGY